MGSVPHTPHRRWALIIQDVFARRAADRLLPRVPGRQRLDLLPCQRREDELRHARLPGQRLGLIQRQANQVLRSEQCSVELVANRLFGRLNLTDDFSAKGRAGRLAAGFGRASRSVLNRIHIRIFPLFFEVSSYLFSQVLSEIFLKLATPQPVPSLRAIHKCRAWHRAEFPNCFRSWPG